MNYTSSTGGGVRLPDGTTRRLIREVFPQYTVSERRANDHGEVIVRARINPDGSVTPLGVVGTPDPALAESALHAVAQWQFEPDHRHPPMLINIPVKFGFSR